MQLTINGESKVFTDGIRVTQLLEQLQMAGKFVAVERNCEVISYKKYAETVLNDGDQLEIVTLVGGG